MTTYREVIYMCLDLIKGMSDDFSFTDEHIAYLIDKYRALLLKQRYGNDPKKHVPYSNYQTLEVDFTPVNPQAKYLKSNTQIPYMLQVGIPRIIANNEDYYDYTCEFTSRERLPFVGYNKYTSKILYCAINEENRVIFPNKEHYWSYPTVEPPEILYFGPTRFKIVGIFENPREVEDEISFNENIDGHEFDRNIPIEEGLITTLIDMVVKELAGSMYIPEDDINNNKDDKSDINSFVRSNIKSNLAKQMDR